MNISVVSDGKKLIESGIFNSTFGAINESQLQFTYDGLFVKLLINLYFDYQSGFNHFPLPNFQATVENGVVILRQPVKCNESPGVSSGFSAMLVPFEVGVKNNGKKIYMSWSIGISRSLGGLLVASTQYSFYEDV
ncbi:hypothetical protein SOV78_03360 [Pectobacterium brasiliense]|uniref:hypothetical protein n=1 Tax=Pectobacterium brasiliense TaxID=180957 RepID=UPI002A840ACE|nr:hypothetical protein [Pectobacterium brasiliense]MDY4333031.1 hypothetical protein [Pectobacterium brasiliense]